MGGAYDDRVRDYRDSTLGAACRIALGTAVLGAAAHLGLSALEPPRRLSGQRTQVGVAATIGGAPIRSGLVVRTLVTADGCSNTARVAVLVAGDSSLWRRYVPSRADVNAIALPSGVLPARASHARIAVSISAAGVRDAPTVSPATVEELLDGLSTETPASHGHGPPVDLVTTSASRRVGGFWVTSASLRGWRATHAALVVRFQARWTDVRSGSTCHVRLPAVFGAFAYDATLAAEQEVHVADPRTTVLGDGLSNRLVQSPVSTASTTLNAGGSDIDVGASTPAPDLVRGQAISWLCRAEPGRGPTLQASAGTFRVYPRSRGVQPPPAPLAGTTPGGNLGCTAAAVVEDRGRARGRAADLLLSGVLALFGVPAILSGLERLARRSRRAWRTRRGT